MNSLSNFYIKVLLRNMNKELLLELNKFNSIVNKLEYEENTNELKKIEENIEEILINNIGSKSLEEDINLILIYSCIYYNKELFSLFERLEASSTIKADFNYLNCSPVSIAIRKNNTELLSILLNDKKAKMKSDNYYMIKEICISNNVKIMEILLKDGINVKTNNFELLMIASDNGYVEMLRMLLREYLSKDKFTRVQRNVMKNIIFSSCLSGKKNIIDLLFEENVEVDLNNNDRKYIELFCNISKIKVEIY